MGSRAKAQGVGMKVGSICRLQGLVYASFNGLLAVVTKVNEDGMLDVELLEQPADFKPNWPIKFGIFQDQADEQADSV